ncbi:MAG: hypothetical protein F4181_07895 [Proteobacteria bacterium]|nr:hypothetical protein [Pseudomonadota bacterium]
MEVMGQSVNQLVTRDHFSAELRLTREYLDASIANLSTELHARIDGVESKLQSLESTVRAEMHAQMMRAVLIVVGVLIPAIGLMLAFVQFYLAGGGGA